jgi:DNA-binding MarR family transcriptional regulator
MSEGLSAVGYGDGPSLLLLADESAARERWKTSVAVAGCRLLGVVPLAGAPDRLADQVATDIVLIEGEGGGAGLEAAVAAVESGAGRFRGIVSAPHELVDRVAGRLDPRLQHLIGADDRERIVALALARIRPRPRLEDVNKAQGTLRLQQLSEEVGRIASLLAALSGDEKAAAAVASLDAQEGGPDAIEAAQVRALIRARRMRDHFFQRDLFADPAWDMLLDLMAARLEGNRVAVSSLCIAAAVPPTTALRWIKMLCDQGLFVRVADPEDGRRVFIELSDGAAAALQSYFKAVQRVAPQPV